MTRNALTRLPSADVAPASAAAVLRLNKAAIAGANALARDAAERMAALAVECYGAASLPGVHPAAREALNRATAMLRAESAVVLRVTP